jgi:hypothetical protein
VPSIFFLKVCATVFQLAAFYLGCQIIASISVSLLHISDSKVLTSLHVVNFCPCVEKSGLIKSGYLSCYSFWLHLV